MRSTQMLRPAHPVAARRAVRGGFAGAARLAGMAERETASGQEWAGRAAAPQFVVILADDLGYSDIGAHVAHHHHADTCTEARPISTETQRQTVESIAATGPAGDDADVRRAPVARHRGEPHHPQAASAARLLLPSLDPAAREFHPVRARPSLGGEDDVKQALETLRSHPVGNQSHTGFGRLRVPAANIAACRAASSGDRAACVFAGRPPAALPGRMRVGYSRR